MYTKLVRYGSGIGVVGVVCFPKRLIWGLNGAHGNHVGTIYRYYIQAKVEWRTHVMSSGAPMSHVGHPYM